MTLRLTFANSTTTVIHLCPPTFEGIAAIVNLIESKARWKVDKVELDEGRCLVCSALADRDGMFCEICATYIESLPPLPFRPVHGSAGRPRVRR